MQGDGTTEWKSQRPTDKSSRKESFFTDAGKRLFGLYEQLGQRTEPLWFELGSTQWDLHDRVYRSEASNLFRLGYGYLDSTIKRNAFLTWRVCVIFSVLRLFDAETDLKTIQSVTASETDYSCALHLVFAYLRHSTAVSRLLNRNADVHEDPHGSRIGALLEELPARFNTATAPEIGAMLDISVRSTKAYLKCLQGGQMIVQTGHGQYECPGG